MRILFVAALIVVAFSGSAAACDRKNACTVGERYYRVHIPKIPTGDRKIGALVFAHGFRGSDAGTMKNQKLVALADELSIALIAIKSKGVDWAIPFAPRDFETDGHEEEAYFEAVLNDAARRFPIDRDRVVMAGFSSGGMVTWHMACHRPDLFTGFIPMSGTFWLNAPANCEQPVRGLVHIHGAADTVVPLSGRKIRNSHQGNVQDALALLTSHGSFGAKKDIAQGNLKCEERLNKARTPLLFCTFQGGHSFSIKHLRFAWRRLTEMPR